jgi:hypothetical protein
MKKSILFTLVTIAFVGCKKEEQETTLIQTPSTGVEIAQIIEKADSELFHRIYEQKLPIEPIVKYIKGVFVWNGTSGGTMSCDRDVNAICMIEVVFPKMVTNSIGGSIEVGEINDTFTQNEEGYLVLNQPVAPISKKVNSVTTTGVSDNNILIGYTE